MDLISTLQRKLEEITDEYEEANKEYLECLAQIKETEEDIKSFRGKAKDNIIKTEECEAKVVEKRSYLFNIEKDVRYTLQEIECVESSLEQIPRSLLKIFNEFAEFSAKQGNLINSICTAAVTSDFWDIETLQVEVEKKREAYRSMRQKFFETKTAKEKELQEELSKEELRLSDLNTAIISIESRIELLNSNCSASDSQLQPTKQTDTQYQPDYEYVTTIHTIIEEVIELEGFNNNGMASTSFSSTFPQSNPPNSFHPGLHEPIYFPDAHTILPDNPPTPLPYQKEVPWFLQHKRRRMTPSHEFYQSQPANYNMDYQAFGPQNGSTGVYESEVDT